MTLYIRVIETEPMRQLARKDIFTCNSVEAWKPTLFVNKKVSIIVQMPDIMRGPIINSQTIIFDMCNKNFIFYNLNRVTFPKMRSVILNSHPCEPEIMHFLDRESQKGTKVCFTEHWRTYVRRWAPSDSKIKILAHEDFEKLFPEGLRTSLHHHWF